MASSRPPADRCTTDRFSPEESLERVTGIGGVFFRSRDPEALTAWYAEHVGVPVQPDGYVVFTDSRDAHVWSPFRDDTDYWPAEKQAMVNFTVPNLDAMLAQLRTAGVATDEHVEELEGIGRFGWAVDPEGNRFELWEPARARRASPLHVRRVVVERVAQDRLLRGSHLVEAADRPSMGRLLQHLG